MFDSPTPITTLLGFVAFRASRLEALIERSSMYLTSVTGLHIEALRAELLDFFETNAVNSSSYGQELAELWQRGLSHVQGGKLIRPVLFLDMYAALTPQGARTSLLCSEKELLRAAAGIELLHYSFLLHDDLIDGDIFRRNRPNIIGELQQQGVQPEAGGAGLSWGQVSALLIGNLLLSKVHQIFASLEVSQCIRDELLRLLDGTIVETVAGELTDVGLSLGTIERELATVMRMTAQKTAAYSFELPFRAAAVLAGAAQEQNQLLSALGEKLGLAYQLQDDLLSAFGSAELHGKDPFSDLREHKYTALIAYAQSTPEWNDHISAIFRQPVTQASATQLQQALIECGAQRFVQRTIDDQLVQVEQACDTQRDVLGDDAGQILSNLVKKLRGRRS